MEIRAGSAGDHDAVVAVWRDATIAFSGAEDVVPEREERARAHLEAPDAFLLVAEDDGGIVGMAAARDGRSDEGRGPAIPGLCHVAMVYVAPARWGEGIGQRLVDAVLAEARGRGYVAAQLFTPALNDHAQRLYEGKGFRRSGRFREAMGLSLVHYERDL